ncbi:MAG: coproporphyrinogen-III oxidase family protein, partial [Parachlamydiaceae bacterium]
MPMIGDILEDQAVSLYVHIPFCTRKCDYCHFYVLPDQVSLKAQFLEGLKLEWERVNELLLGKKIETLYFGGGTPYLLGAPAIQTIIDWIASLQEIETMEITLEANPENMDPHTLKEYRAAGINRLSVGLQSLDDHQLITLSRRHTAKKGIESIEMAFDAGFTNISIDLMYDLPNQTLESWTRTVERATQLPISHLS